MGIDTISAGGVIAFAIECFKEGIITPEMTEGKNLEWGDTDSFSWLAEKIAKQVGIGAVLSLGTKKAAQIFGNGADKFAIQIKGMEQ